MFGVSKVIVGLDVGSYSVKAVALQPNGSRLTLVGCAQARIGTSEPAEVIRKVIDQLGVKPKRVVTSVSGRSVIVRQVETPRMPQAELKAHIAYEADKYIPFGAEEVIIDCQQLPDVGQVQATTMQVLLVAVRRGFVEDHINQLRSAGIAPETIDVDVFALSNAYELLGPASADPADLKEATALIDIGASKTNIAIMQGTRLLFTREVYQAGNEITDAIVRTFNETVEDIERIKANPGETLEALIDAAMPAFEDLANEIRLSFDYVEGQFEIPVTKAVLSGGSSQLSGIAGILSGILGRPVHVFDPLAGLDLVPSRYDIHTLDATSPSLAVALGLASHLTAVPATGLGGSNSHGWVPPQSRNESFKSALMQSPALSSDAVHHDLDGEAPPAENDDSQAGDPNVTASTHQMAAPRSPLPFNIPAEQMSSRSSSDDMLDPNQSGLLIVLDEEVASSTGQFDKPGAPTFDRTTGTLQKGTGSISKATTGSDSRIYDLGDLHTTPPVLKVDEFDVVEDDDDKKDPSMPGLPQLPKL